jgi:hypothetical protein
MLAMFAPQCSSIPIGKAKWAQKKSGSAADLQLRFLAELK